MLGFAVSVEGVGIIRAKGRRRTAGMAKRVLRAVGMAQSDMNISWVLANLAPVEAEYQDCIDFGYLSRVPVAGIV